MCYLRIDGGMKDIVPVIPIEKVVSSKFAQCLSSLGYRKISLIQYRAFKSILKGFSTIIVSPTGTGKTEAALLPILYYIWRRKLEPINAIYVTPLRALNRDIVERINRIIKCFGLKADLRHGDTPRRLRRAIKENPGHIIVTTPETLQYIIVDRDFREKLRNLRFIVVDEYREVVTSKRGLELLSAINMVERLIKRRLVKVALTATLSDINKSMCLLDNPSYMVPIISSSVRELEIHVETPKASGEVVEEVDPCFYARLEHIRDIVDRHNHVLVFTNTRDLAERLTWGLSKLVGLEDRVGVHHGSLSRHHRLGVEELFKKRVLKALVATSSLELGIDIGHIDYVVQYMSPRQSVRLVQRIGRSLHRVESVPRGSIVTLDNFYDILESIALAVRAVRGDLEGEDIPYKPLDVLAHQIVLRVLIEPGIPYNDLYIEFSTSRVFQGLSEEEFRDVLDYLVSARILRVRSDRVYPSVRARPYFYRVTMIPDTRVIPVIDVSSNRRIGVLNEEFIVLHVVEGSVIVLGGGLWRVISFDEDNGKLFVEPVTEYPMALIPRWEGESIPVEYSVAREIGAWIRLYREGFNVFKKLVSGRVIVDGYGVDKVFSVINELKREGIPVPSDRDIVVEVNRSDKTIVFYGFYGSKVANTFKELLTAIVRRYITPRVVAYTTPYYVMLCFLDYFPRREELDIVVSELAYLGRDRGLFTKHLLSIISGSSHFLWRVFFVGQRFGAIDPSSSKRITKTLLKTLASTVIGREALKETLLKDFDLENMFRILNNIYRGRVKIRFVITDKPTQLYVEAVQRIPGISIVYPVIDIGRYRERVLRRTVTTICMMCGYKWSGRVRDYLNYSEIRCPKCGSKYVAVVKGDGCREQEIILKVITKKRLSSEERSIYRDLQRRAMLIMDHGVRALTILASRGVGFTEAVRIINKPVYSEDDLFRYLYEAEKKYIRIKKFLD